MKDYSKQSHTVLLCVGQKSPRALFGSPMGYAPTKLQWPEDIFRIGPMCAQSREPSRRLRWTMSPRWPKHPSFVGRRLVLTCVQMHQRRPQGLSQNGAMDVRSASRQTGSVTFSRELEPTLHGDARARSAALRYRPCG